MKTLLTVVTVVTIVLVLGMYLSIEAAVESKMTKINTGNVVCVTPGTPVQFSTSSVPTNQVFITGFFRTYNGLHAVSHDVDKGLFVGDSTVCAGGIEDKLTLSTRKGVLVISTDSIMLPAGDLNMLYLDSVNTYDGVAYVSFAN